MFSFQAVVGLAMLGFVAPALAQQATNIRGTITSFDGKVIAIKTQDSRDITVDLPETVNVAITRPFTMADVKPGMTLGVTTVVRDDKVVAIDVRPIPPAAPAGLSSYDLAPQSTMTNAVLEASVAASGGNELTLNYKTGTVKVLVPPGTPMSQSAPGTRADLKPGETIYVAARNDGGKYTAVRVQVSKDGVKPTQ
ncbi:hypothetical protein [Beijerinckia sp. GAS462]|nr:hypothetical protein [Beijerinckia sp. GAS462]